MPGSTFIYGRLVPFAAKSVDTRRGGGCTTDDALTPSFPYHGRWLSHVGPCVSRGYPVGPRERCSLRACCGSSGGWWSGLLGRWVVRLPVVTPLSATSLPTPLGLHPMASPWDEGREGKGISSLATVAAVRLLRGLTLLCASPALVVEGRLDSSVEPKAPTGTYGSRCQRERAQEVDALPEEFTVRLA